MRIVGLVFACAVLGSACSERRDRARPIHNAPASIAPQVCAGDHHTCVLRPDGTVMCAGRNLDGQLGDGTTQDRPSFVPVRDLHDATQIDCGAATTCARRATGAIVCWGRGAAGELGNGAAESARTPTTVRGIDDGAEVTCGRAFACARRTSGQVACWGEGSEGQLGDGRAVDTREPVPVTGLNNAAAIDAGTAHVCARQATGRVVCWGRNGSRQLGQGDATARATTPVQVTSLTGVTLLGVAGSHSCAATARALFCWGENGNGQIMNGREGSSATDVGTPWPVPGIAGVEALALGAQSTCLRLAGGEVRCAGYNNHSAQLLTTGSTERVVTSPSAVTGVDDAIALGVGATHACAIRRRGALVCWGQGSDGQRGDGRRTGGAIRDVVPDVARLSLTPSRPSSFPETASEPEHAASPHLALGDRHVCGVVADGRVRCFGEGDGGQLGTGATADLPSSTERYVEGITDARAVVARANHTCVVRTNGRVACFGTPGTVYRDPIHEPTSTPVPIDALQDVSTLALGMGTMCAVKRDHTVWCLGANEAGQLGNGTRTRSAVAVQVEGIGDAEAIAAASSTFCVVRTGGALACWGYGGYGELGNGASTPSTTPVTPALTGVTAIDGAYYDFCAVHDGGRVSCWGDNDYGQIGNGAAAREPNVLTPTAALGVRGAIHVGVGYGTVCATTLAGEAMCWGANAFGQTGHDATEPNPQPTPWQVLRARDAVVSTFAPFASVDCGSNHCCGLHRDGHVSCWGSTPIGGAGGLLGTAATRRPFPIAAPGVVYPAPTDAP